jgi:hypothetical protein
MNFQTSVIAVSIVSAAALASTSANPDGNRLPLRMGFYLAADVPCGEAFSAAMVQIMGNRIEAGRELCTIKSLSRHGTAFTATDECQDTTTGAKRLGKMKMVISDDHTFVFGATTHSTRYRYSPIASLPASFKDAQEMVPDTPPIQEPR